MNLGPLNWLADEKALMAMLAANEVQGLGLVATVIFCATGLVVLPFLPGDSLLFAIGAFAGLAHHSPLAPCSSTWEAPWPGPAWQMPIRSVPLRQRTRASSAAAISTSITHLSGSRK